MIFSSETSIQLEPNQKSDAVFKKTPSHGSRLSEEPVSFTDRLEESLSRAADRLLALQSPQGYWVFDLEADATIPSEYLFLQRFRNKQIDSGLRERIAT